MPYESVNRALAQTKYALSRTTKSLHPAEVVPEWFLIDAENLVLGRMASIIASRLRGKHKPQFTQHVDCGDRIIVINAEKLAMTGKKLDQDILYRHTGHSGGIKSESSRSILEGKHPERRLKKAVQRMMPSNTLSDHIFRKNLYVYAGPNHPHAAQQPQFLDVARLNPKNVKGGERMAINPLNPGIIQEIEDKINKAFKKHVDPLKTELMGHSDKLHKENAEQISALRVELTAIRNNTGQLVSEVQRLISKLEPK